MEDIAQFQILLFSNEQSCAKILPTDAVNVPATSHPEQLNMLVNRTGEIVNGSENWESVKLDFLIESILLRTSLIEFVETYKLSLEDVLRIECIWQAQAPESQQDLLDGEWIADLKSLNENCLISVNYGGELTVWSGSNKLEKATTINVEDVPLKCLDVFKRGDDLFTVVGSQNQTLTVFRVEVGDNKRGRTKWGLTPQTVLRGHQRSVECVAVNADGSRAISGSFDKLLKVWNIETLDSEHPEEQSDDIVVKDGSGARKKAKTNVYTKIPMVTLEAHKEAVVDLSWDPLKESQAVTVSWDHQMLLWDLELAGPISTLTSNKAFTALALHPKSGIALTGMSDPIIRMWDFRSKEGSMVKSTYLGHMGWVSDVAWCPGVDHLFVSGSFDKTVKMWDTRSPKAALYDLMGHEDRVLCVDWSLRGRICSGSVDCSIKLFSQN